VEIINKLVNKKRNTRIGEVPIEKKVYDHLAKMKISKKKYMKNDNFMESYSDRIETERFNKIKIDGKFYDEKLSVKIESLIFRIQKNKQVKYINGKKEEKKISNDIYLFKYAFITERSIN
jgi:hypothetical protein